MICRSHEMSVDLHKRKVNRHSFSMRRDTKTNVYPYLRRAVRVAARRNAGVGCARARAPVYLHVDPRANMCTGCVRGHARA